MTEEVIKKKNMFQVVMHYGALLGLFWMFKYLFKIGEEYWTHFIYFYMVLQICTPLLMYFFYMKYIDYSGKKSTIWKSILFCLGLGFCASLFEDVMIFAHYGLINSNVLYQIVSQIGEVSSISNLQKVYPTIPLDELQKAREMAINLFSPRFVLVCLLFTNTLFQTILSAIFGLIIGFFPPSNYMRN